MDENRKLVVKGFKAAAVEAGIKKANRLDLALIVAEQPATVAGVLTRSRVKAAPVLLCKDRLRAHHAQAILVNSGNANACSGTAGRIAALESSRAAAQLLGIADKLVLPASTGVIGQVLPLDKITAALPSLVARLHPEGLAEAARAIMTTDTFPKTAQVWGQIDGQEITVAGMAKGAGMIHPDMATLLVFILTDAAVSSKILKKCLQQGLSKSFNRITVDGDTSTNDSILLLASGQAGNHPVVTLDTPEGQAFAGLLQEVMADLAYQVVKDGEGARHVYRIVVEAAAKPLDAEKAARTVALSPLVKTAIAGEDANWGRIMAALGRSGAKVHPEKVDIWFGPHQIVKAGLGLGAAVEQQAHELMQTGTFDLIIRLNLGRFADYYLTCDFTEDYVKINADYRT